MAPATVRRIESRLTETVGEAGAMYAPEGAALAGPIRFAVKVAELMRPLMGDAATEEFWLLTLDAKHRVVGAGMISRGTLTSSLVHPREVFGPALRLGAAAIIVCHNHPTGDPTPSKEDVKVTERLHQAGKLLGVPLLDHVILGGEDHVALRDRMSL